MRFLFVFSFIIISANMFCQALKVSENTSDFHFLFDPGKNWRSVGYEEWKKTAPMAMRSLEEDASVGKMMLIVPIKHKNIDEPPFIFIQASEVPTGIFTEDSLKKMSDIIWTQNPYLVLERQKLDPKDSLGLAFLNGVRESKTYYDPEHKCIVTRLNYSDDSKKRFDMLTYQYFGEGWMVNIRFTTDDMTHAKMGEFLSMIRNAQFEREYRVR